ncbi:glycoside hydrolase family protein [Angustibacter luteus]|uniref:Glycosyl hydrolase family 32 n=1 Tax=Angustibacter luteus TaxID=658456 RepID=A0ABW1JAD3_9ACTN
MPSPSLPLPTAEGAQVVVAAPAPGPGNWAGAASAVLVDGTTYLTYRVRRPLTDGRGVAVVVARSDDGVHFEPVCAVRRTEFGAESFERPALVPLPDGGWRLYLSCATPGSKHWWIDSLTAPTVEELPRGERRLVLPGDERTAVKDPVIEVGPDGWHLWLCCHPLTELGEEDRMSTRYLTSADGLEWQDRGEVLTGRANEWDERGARVTTVLCRDPLAVLYDGRRDAASNWYERTGVAVQRDGRLEALDGVRLGSPHGDGALRYACAVRQPDGRTRFYFEAAREDGAHDLMTSLA